MANYYDVGIGFVPDPAGYGPDALMALVSQPILQSGADGGEAIHAIVSRVTATTSYGQAWDYYGDPGTSLTRGPSGTWDSGEVCCASLIAGANSITVWYSGRGSDHVWRIGEAQLLPDGQFYKNKANPLLSEGLPGSIDQRGVSDPEVVWDEGRKLYRMWYVAHDSLDQNSICLATSADGVRWAPYPQNRVFGAGDAGFRSVAYPTGLLTGDGLMRMWVEAESLATTGVAIFELRNSGILPP